MRTFLPTSNRQVQTYVTSTTCKNCHHIENICFSLLQFIKLKILKLVLLLLSRRSSWEVVLKRKMELTVLLSGKSKFFKNYTIPILLDSSVFDCNFQQIQNKFDKLTCVLRGLGRIFRVVWGGIFYRVDVTDFGPLLIS